MSSPDHSLDEKAIGKHNASNESELDPGRRISIIGATSPGVQRMEAVAAHMTTFDRIFIFIGVFIIGYAYGLDGLTRFIYQGYATGDYLQHSLLATINVLRGVIAAAAQPTAAKIADVFGRLELVAVSVVFYVVGTIVEATSTGVKSFCAGAVIYQIGYTSILLLVEVIIADITSMRTRVAFSYIPALPFVINTWISGYVTDAVTTNTTWQWGIGMWAIIYTACSLPLMLGLWIAGRRARKAGALDKYRTPFQHLGAKRLAVELFWRLDVIGIILLIAVFALILVPLTVAGGTQSKWATAHVIAPLVIGILCIPVFVFSQRKAPYPLVPFHLLKDRGVWAALLIACTLNFTWYMQGDFLFPVLRVAFDFDVLKATQVSSLYSFCSTVIGLFVGLIIIRVRRLKPFILAGTSLFMVAFGMLIHYRGDASTSSGNGVIGAQVVLGIAGGLFPYVTQASIQASTVHEHVAVITGLYLACYNIGFALGSCVSGAIWTQLLPNELINNLRSFGNETIAPSIYANPYAEIAYYPVGTPERAAIIMSYQHVQKLLCITGICLCVPLILWATLLRNPKLSNLQSQPEAEKDTDVR